MNISKLKHGFKISPILADLCHIVLNPIRPCLVLKSWEDDDDGDNNKDNHKDNHNNNHKEGHKGNHINNIYIGTTIRTPQEVVVFCIRNICCQILCFQREQSLYQKELWQCFPFLQMQINVTLSLGSKKSFIAAAAVAQVMTIFSD